MKFILGWGLKLGVVGALYLGATSGVKIKLPDEILGYKVPVSAQRFVDRNAQIGELGTQTQDAFKNIAGKMR